MSLSLTEQEAWLNQKPCKLLLCALLITYSDIKGLIKVFISPVCYGTHPPVKLEQLLHYIFSCVTQEGLVHCPCYQSCQEEAQNLWRSIKEAARVADLLNVCIFSKVTSLFCCIISLLHSAMNYNTLFGKMLDCIQEILKVATILMLKHWRWRTKLPCITCSFRYAWAGKCWMPKALHPLTARWTYG